MKSEITVNRFFSKMCLIIIFLFGLDQFLIASDYSDFFADSTLFYTISHLGNSKSESIILGNYYFTTSWSGRRVNLDSTLNIGEYRLEIRDTNNQIRFLHEFASVFNEWRQTEKANSSEKRISEIIQLPYPNKKCTIVLFSRDNQNHWIKQIKIEFDPRKTKIIHRQRLSKTNVIDWKINGKANKKIDLLLVADGYLSSERELFMESCRHILRDLFEQQPFSSFENEFNSRFFFVPSDSSGITSSAERTRFGLHFGFLGMNRYLMSKKLNEVYKAIAGIPAEYIVLVGHSEKYGGGGIYNNITALTGENPWSSFLFIHEFGHSFVGLGDEYYIGEEKIGNVYRKDIEPISPNITIHADRLNLKWRSLTRSQQELPTEWHKLRFDEISDSMNTLNATLNLLGTKNSVWQKIIKIKDRLVNEKSKILSDSLLTGVIGAFEGAAYHSTDFFRPALNCIMFSVTGKEFDVVCREAIIHRIEYLTKKW